MGDVLMQVADLRAQGYVVDVIGNNLLVKPEVPPELREEIRAHKAQLIAELTGGYRIDLVTETRDAIEKAQNHHTWKTGSYGQRRRLLKKYGLPYQPHAGIFDVAEALVNQGLRPLSRETVRIDSKVLDPPPKDGDWYLTRTTGTPRTCEKCIAPGYKYGLPSDWDFYVRWVDAPNPSDNGRETIATWASKEVCIDCGHVVEDFYLDRGLTTQTTGGPEWERCEILPDFTISESSAVCGVDHIQGCRDTIEGEQ